MTTPAHLKTAKRNTFAKCALSGRFRLPSAPTPPRPPRETRASRELYQNLAATSPLVAVLGHDVPPDLGGGVRGVDLQPEDPLCEEWVIVALGADTALVARELPGPAERDSDRHSNSSSP